MRILRCLAFLWLLLVSLSCAHYGNKSYHYIRLTPPAAVAKAEVPIWIDKNFSAADLESLDGAIAEWNFVLNGHVKLVVVSRIFDMEPSEILKAKDLDGWLVMKIDSRNEVVREKNWLAYCDRVGGHYMYMVRDRLRDGDVKQVGMHELGHLLGSEHVGEHLMYKYYVWGRYSCIDRETAEEVAMHWNLTPDRLNFCVPD